MLPINIDPTDFIEQSALSGDEINDYKALLLASLGAEFKSKWEDQINENLHSTRAEYRAGMFTETGEDFIVMGVTARQSRLAVNLELGKEAFDEKVGFALSPKKTMKKDGKGWYLTIPFRFATNSALGESSVFADKMPLAVYKIAKNQATPVRKTQLPADLQQPTIRPEIRTATKTFAAYQHKASIYEGTTRLVDKDENRGKYMVFRRVSDLTDQNAFIHPGFLPYNLIGKAAKTINYEQIIRTSKIEFFNER
jgi:hypothetical protein